MNIFQRNAKKLVIVPVMAGAASVIFVRLIEAGPLVIGFHRLGLSALIFGIPIIFGGYKKYHGVTRKDFLFCVLAGFLLFCHFIGWFTALQTTSIARAVVLFSLHPFTVLIATYILLKRKVKIKAILGILSALIGGAIVAVVNQTLDGNFIFGDIMGFASGLFFGLYFLIGQIMRSKMETLNYVFIVFTSCFVFFAIAMVVTGTPFTGYSTSDYFWFVMITLVCQVLAHAMFNWCVGYVSSLYVSVFTSMQTVVGVIYGILVFREIPVPLQWLGVFITVAGLIYYNINSQETPKDER